MRAENESKITGVANEANMLKKKNQILLNEIEQKILTENTQAEKEVLMLKNDIEKKINDKMMDKNLMKFSI